jgi:hypothetical protein
MTTEQLNCNQCGNPLEVPQTARYATCGQCGAQLTIQRSGGASYTQEGSAPKVQEMALQLEQLTLENKLLHLDRAWEAERESYMRTGRYGKRYIPTVGASIFTGLAAAVAGTVVTFFSMNLIGNLGGLMGGFSSMFPVFGIMITVLGIGGSLYNYNLASRYERAHAEYYERRRQLLAGGDVSQLDDDGGVKPSGRWEPD